jgi:hypothetical protein
MPDEKMRAAVRHVMGELRKYMDDMDARDPHLILITDPETGQRSGNGPYPDREAALAAMEKLQADMLDDDPEFQNLQYEVVWMVVPEEEP